MSDAHKSTQVTDIPKVENTSQDPNDYSLDQLLRLIRLERTQSLSGEYKNTLNQLRMGQLKTSILTDLRRYISLSKNKDGKFDASDSEFQDLIKRSNEKYESLSQELINAGENPQDMETFGDLLKSVGIEEGKKKYNAEETQELLNAIKMTVDQLTPLNEMHMQTVTRLEGEMNETYQLLMAAYKPLHNAITMMARGIKGN